MTVLNFRGQSITFDTAVEMFLSEMLVILSTLFLEPLERELAVQVEYDMDEQGAFMDEHWGMSFTKISSRYGVARQREWRTQEGTGGQSVLRDLRDHYGPLGEGLV